LEDAVAPDRKEEARHESMLYAVSAALVLLSIQFFARRDDLLWGRLLTCGRLLIGLLVVPATPGATLALSAACRDAGQDGIRRPAGGLATRRRMPSCPTFGKRLHFHVAHPTQIAIINQVFAPRADEIEYAEKVARSGQTRGWDAN
jgi:hypothetical protein